MLSDWCRFSTGLFKDIYPWVTQHPPTLTVCPSDRPCVVYCVLMASAESMAAIVLRPLVLTPVIETDVTSSQVPSHQSSSGVFHAAWQISLCLGGPYITMSQGEVPVDCPLPGVAGLVQASGSVNDLWSMRSRLGCLGEEGQIGIDTIPPLWAWWARHVRMAKMLLLFSPFSVESCLLYCCACSCYSISYVGWHP